MGTEKRERQKANRTARLEAERSAAKKGEQTRKIATFVVLGVLIFAALFLFSVLSGGDDDETEEGETVDASGQLDTSEAEGTDADSAEPSSDDPICPAEDGSSERVTEFAAPVPLCIDIDASYVAEITTDKGTVTVELDATAAPNTVNNFVTLARYHFYDGVTFHRVIPGFMVQGGDAVGNPAGTGNPGYRFDDELPEAGEYQIGSIAMANSGPNTNGSQFFIVTGQSGVALPPSYSLFGHVTSGMEAVTAIEETGSPSGAPSETSIIESIDISEK